jgi:RNA polymerase sigma-70 factor (ECF subfamily)
LDDERNPIDIAADNEEESRLDDAQDLKLIRLKLPLLKEEYREIIIMRFINDLTLEEIADITKKSRGNIRVIIHRALTALRELIEEEKGGK